MKNNNSISLIRKSMAPVIALAVASSFAAGCGGGGKDTDDSDGEAVVRRDGVEIPRQLEEVVNHLKKAGFEIGDSSEKNYKLIGATAGFGLEVAGKEIELYYYDPAKADREVLDRLSGLHKPEGTMAVLINGHHQMVVALHPEQEKLIETFMDFQK